MIRSPATVTPLLCWLSTKHNLIDLAEHKQIEEHQRERVNTQFDIADVYKAKIKMGFKI